MHINEHEVIVGGPEVVRETPSEPAESFLSLYNDMELGVATSKGGVDYIKGCEAMYGIGKRLPFFEVAVQSPDEYIDEKDSFALTLMEHIEFEIVDFHLEAARCIALPTAHNPDASAFIASDIIGIARSRRHSDVYYVIGSCVAPEAKYGDPYEIPARNDSDDMQQVRDLEDWESVMRYWSNPISKQQFDVLQASMKERTQQRILDAHIAKFATSSAVDRAS